MYLVKNKTLCDTDGNVLLTVDNEIILTEDVIEDYLTKEDMDVAIRQYHTIPLFKLLLLNPDETVREDITSSITDNNISYSHEYKSGQCRSVSTTFLNNDGEWLPNPVKGKNWSGTKVGLYMGLLYNNIIYWFPAGIYYLSSPSISAGENSVSLNFVDKFAMLDGTLGGTTESEYKIEVDNPVCNGIATLLQLDIGNGEVFDVKPFLYPSQFVNEKTPYTLEKNPESNIGEIILELSEMLSCEISYNEGGYLDMLPADELTKVDERPITLHITDDDLDMSGVTIDVDYTKIINKVTVVGANINGKIVSYTAINNNPASPSSILFTPPKFLYIADDNIYSGELCKERAKYELQKASFLGLSVSAPLRIWVPFVKGGDLITWTSEKYGFKGVKFIVNSVNVSGDGSVKLSITNTKELPF